jgi:PAS domain S-box-containing protein
MNRPIRTLLNTGFAVAVAVLVINALVSLLDIRRVGENNRRVLRTADHLKHLEATLSRLKDAETGQRGFLLTGQEPYLEPYHAALASLGEDMRGLAKTSESPRRVEALAARVAEKLAELEETIDLRRREGPEAANRVVLSGRGKRIMDDIRRLVEEIAGRERELLSRRVAESEAGLARFTATFALASLIAVAVLLLLYRAVSRHLAARERSEERLRGQIERWRVTLASIGDAVIVTDADGRVTFMNPVAGSLCGWIDDTAAGRPLAEVFRIVDERTRLATEAPVARVLREGVVVGLANHTLLIARDGSERPIDDSAAPIRDGHGRVAGVVLVFRDVTERRRVEVESERLRERERAARERTERVLASITDAFVAADRDWRIVEINPAAATIFGRTREELVGKVMWEEYPQAIDSEFYRQYHRAMAEQVPVHFEAASAIVDRWFEAHAYPSPEGLSIYLRDITERKAAEAERERHLQRLREDDRRKDEFLAMLAHEIRNPLASIRSAVEIFGMPGSQDHLGWAKEVIGRQVNHLAHLLDDLLDVSRITRGLIQVRKQLIDAYPVINQAVESVRPLIDDRHQRLDVSISPRPLRLEADSVRLEQVLVNLLTNAARYTPAGGRIALSAEQVGDQLVLRVADTGMGIPPEVLPRVFDLFAQGERALARSEGGLGIGLTIVRRLVELHGGSVSARSEGPGQGSEFIVRLPAAEEWPSAPPAPASAVRQGRGCRILIVDDNRALARSLGQLLKVLGHEVELAHDGPEGLEAARAHRPEVILLDIGLPTMDGYTVARALRQEGFGDTLIIAVSGYGQEDDRRRSREAGMDHHLTKPVDLETISELIALAG